MTEDEKVGQHHQLDGHEFEQAPGDSEEQGSLACCSPWGRKESDTTKQLNNNNIVLLSMNSLLMNQQNGHEFKQTQGDSEGQGSLVSCSPWGHKESDTTEGLN